MERRYPGYLREYVWQQKARKVSRFIIEIIIVVALAFFCSYYFFRMNSVADSAMEGTLYRGDYVLLNSASYILGEPKRGDIIAFRTADDENAVIVFRRVIGLPRENIKISGGIIYIDGEPYNEPGDFPAIINGGLAEDGITLGGNEYFVLGDNRNMSEDSRHPGIGIVKKSAVKGKGWFCIKPSSHFGFVG